MLNKKRTNKSKLTNYSDSDSDSNSSSSSSSSSIQKITNKNKKKTLEKSTDSTINPYTKKPYSQKYYEILEKRKSLPAWSAKKKLFQLMDENQVIILEGETGSGKTTQVPQFLLEKFDKIGITQPRRVAAMSVAKRVSEEMDVKLGEEVGYNIRFEDMSTVDTRLKYMTDGMLLKEAMSDQLLSRYDLLILDECHERTLATEILFGLMKEILPKRKDLKLIVMSATINIEQFKDYFHAPLLSIPGRVYNVDIKYLDDCSYDYLEDSVDFAIKIHEEEPEGDILIFLTGEEEIELCCNKIRERTDVKNYGYLEVVPLYSTLPPKQQQKIFEPAPGVNKNGKKGRKVVVATNIAETSITIDGIVYVIDSGFSKQKVYNPRLKMESLLVSPISKANAKQRSGRAGRTKEGKCYRLYSKETHDKDLEENAYPEILRSNLASVILTLRKLKIDDLAHFDFMDPPAPETMMSALELLNFMGAIDDDAELTEEGLIMAHTPLDPELSKTLISSEKYKCVNEILTIVSLLSIPGIFSRPRNQAEYADQCKLKFTHSQGDHFTMLLAYNSYKQSKNPTDFCRTNFLSLKNLKAADNIRDQLEKMLLTNGISSDKENDFALEFKKPKITKVLKALLAGNFAKVAHLQPAGCYYTVKEHQMVLIHPSCGLTYKPSWIIYNDFVCTSKNYLRIVTKFDPEVLFDVAKDFYTLDDSFPNGSIKRELLKIQAKLNDDSDYDDVYKVLHKKMNKEKESNDTYNDISKSKKNNKKYNSDSSSDDDSEDKKNKIKNKKINKDKEILKQNSNYSKYTSFKK